MCKLFIMQLVKPHLQIKSARSPEPEGKLFVNLIFNVKPLIFRSNDVIK